MKYFTEAQLRALLTEAYHRGWERGTEQGQLGQNSMLSEDDEDCDETVNELMGV